jgi:hypothetical protein
MIDIDILADNAPKCKEKQLLHRKFTNWKQSPSVIQPLAWTDTVTSLIPAGKVGQIRKTGHDSRICYAVTFPQEQIRLPKPQVH